MRAIGRSFEGLDALVARRGEALLATATLLAGGPAAGEDLLQAALERVMRHWHRVKDEPEIYLRRTIYHLAVDHWRARRRRPEVLGRTETELDSAAVRTSQTDGTDAINLRLALIQELAQLPPRQRAVLVPPRALTTWYADYTGVYKLAGKSGAGAQAVDTYDFRYHVAGDTARKLKQAIPTRAA